MSRVSALISAGSALGVAPARLMPSRPQAHNALKDSGSSLAASQGEYQR